MLYEIGQEFPHTPSRGVVTEGRDVQWVILNVQSGTEKAVVAKLKKERIYSFYPKETLTRHIRGQKVEMEKPIVAGYVFTRFRGNPQWDVLKGRRLILDMVTVQGEPFLVPKQTIRRLLGLTVRAEEMRQEREEMERSLFDVKPGEDAILVTGPFKDLVVKVLQVSTRAVKFENENFKGEALIGQIKKVVI